MANLEKVVYLTEAQKETLFTNGILTANGNTITYNDNDLYITPEENKIVYENKAAVSGGTDASLVTTGEKYIWNSKASKPTKKTISLATSWSGNGPYTQTVTISNYTITANSKVDLQPDTDIISQMISDSIQALYIDNNNGTLTAYAVGAAPTAALTVQCTVTEVDV